MKKRLLALLVLLVPLSTLAQAPEPGPEVGIRAVIESFRMAIIEKDKPRFLALFVPGHVGWQSARGDDTVRRMRVKTPQAPKVRFNPENNHLSFIDGLETNHGQEGWQMVRTEEGWRIVSVTWSMNLPPITP